jgi:predicted ATPase/DNA-binding winged helix-turn-helix (wHTH) protein
MIDDGNPPTKDAVSFGPFRLIAAERLLERRGAPLHLGARALDVLIVLVGRAGEVVTRKELMSRVWPDVTVDESSLRVHVAGLRKALGDGSAGARYVTNVPGRGYCFVAPISRSSASKKLAAVETIASDQAHRLPARLMRMIGRDDTVCAISAELAARRFVTIVGPGGMGKTTVAVSVGHALLAEFDGAVSFVDLGSIINPLLVPGAVLSTLGLAVRTDDPMPALLAFLRDKRALLILDSCEHVIEAAAALAEGLFAGAPQIHVLATSREALRVEGELVHRLLPLETPPDGTSLTAAETLVFPAVQLFLERAAASGSRVELSDADAPIVGQICRKLDGIALAIELVSGRVDAYGIRETAALLDNRLRLLWQGRRTALPRHQTLNAMLDWSYNLLSELERTVLRRLSVFVGIFTLDAAQMVAAESDTDRVQVIAAVGSLVGKSLVSADGGGAAMRYRLLDTTRACLLGKLIESDELDSVQRRHADYFSGFLGHVDNANSSDLEAETLSSEHLGNIRAALEWSFSDRGDISVGGALVAASASLFLKLSLLSECHRWSERAITALDDSDRGTRREMELQGSFGLSLMFTKGNSEEVGTAFARALDIAEKLQDPHSQLRLLGGLNIFLTRIADFRGALAVAQRAEAIAKTMEDPAAAAMIDWMLASSHHLTGNPVSAHMYGERGTTGATLPRRINSVHVGHDHRNLALVVVARTLWFRGYADRAENAARQTIEEADELEHPVTLAIALVWTVPVFLWNGNWAAAEEMIERLIRHAASHSLGPYHAVGLGLKGELLVKRGEARAGIALLRECLKVLHLERHEILSTVFNSALAEGLAIAGRPDEALATIDDAIAQVKRTGRSFNTPEILRIKGHLLASMPRPDRSAAEHYLERSLECARRQGALAWELRTAMSLAQVRSSQHRRREAQRALAAVYGRFTEGFETADLKAAKRLLDEPGAPADG